MKKENIFNSTKITKYQYKTLWASTIGYAVDGLDMMILAFCLPMIMAYYNLDNTAGGFLTTITLIGAVIGGFIFGPLADKYGRVRVFTWTILIFSIFTGLCAFSTNLEMFAFFRFMSGLGLGGEFGIGMTIVSETWNKEYRSRATSIVAIGFQFGIILATSSVLLCKTLGWGWQGVFLIGTLPAIFVAWSRKNLEEPPVWLQLKNDNKNKFAVHKLFNSKRTTVTTLGLIIATSVQNIGFFGIMSWMPTIMANELNIAISGTTAWTIFTISGMISGIVVFGWLCDKLGKRPSYIIFLLISATVSWLYFKTTNIAILIPAGFILGFFVNGMIGGYGALLAEHYSTDVRSTAENIIFNIGRALSGFTPFIIGYLSRHYSLSYVLGFIAFGYILSALSFLFLIPETKDKELE